MTQICSIRSVRLEQSVDTRDIMESIQTHPTTAAQAKAFTAPGSLAFPGGSNEFAPAPNGETVNGQVPVPNGQQPANGNGVTPATPAATPAAAQGGSGLTPTLQYVSPA
jgi:transcription initiation factor TFIID TATA-box-binding protein